MYGRVLGSPPCTQLDAVLSPMRLQLLVDYDVPPAHEAEFVKIFKELQSEVEKEEGALVFGLSRALDQNNVFWLYR